MIRLSPQLLHLARTSYLDLVDSLTLNPSLMSSKYWYVYLLVICDLQENGTKYVRPIYAGNAMSTVTSSDKIKLFTVRSTNFEKVQAGSSPNSYSVEETVAQAVNQRVNGSKTPFLSRRQRSCHRRSLWSAAAVG